ncbi:hypothetical protein [Mucilaginibacter sp. L3T2-6]|uniref:hypothetical protein n=1 Tax=Mucilaginibacter sp. L3T2-6 TaxID=3062491 RepID=UPI0026762F2B|nr:hypothetical protein [Mucilaginibacter sp. L3T2-6]
MEPETANNYMFNELLSSNVQFSRVLVNKARSLNTDMQADCARILVRLFKAYTESDAFAKAYKKYRVEHLPRKSHGFHIPKPSELLGQAKNKLLNGDASADLLPTNPKEIIKKRLEEFLKVSATVNFDAKLNGRLFADVQYEAESSQWKMYYRAGRPVIEAAQAEVKSWLETM